MVGCRGGGGSHEWELNRLGQLRHLESNLCLDGGALGAGDNLEMRPCDTVPTQSWTFEFYAPGYEHLKPAKP